MIDRRISLAEEDEEESEPEPEQAVARRSSRMIRQLERYGMKNLNYIDACFYERCFILRLFYFLTMIPETVKYTSLESQCLGLYERYFIRSKNHSFHHEDGHDR